jgi:ABC-2 type transport system ATP-binding protein
MMDPQPTKKTVILDEVSVFYGEVVGLSKVELTLGPGITGVVGPNGSGKSTIMRVLTGLISPAEGRVTVLGGNPFSDAAIRSRIGLVPATECFHGGLSGRRNLEVMFLSQGDGKSRSREKATAALKLVGLTKDGDRRYGTWSRGMRQRLKIGLTLAGDAEIVLLDEPFLGVDPPSRRLLQRLIQEMAASGLTLFVSSHVLHEIETLTDRVCVLAHGRVLGFGKIEQLLLELRDQHPHRIRLISDDPRGLATALLTLPHISEVKLIGNRAVELVTGRPDLAYRQLAEVVVNSDCLIHRIETLDNGLEAVFHHVTQAGSRHL